VLLVAVGATAEVWAVRGVAAGNWVTCGGVVDPVSAGRWAARTGSGWPAGRLPAVGWSANGLPEDRWPAESWPAERWPAER